MKTEKKTVTLYVHAKKFNWDNVWDYDIHTFVRTTDTTQMFELLKEINLEIEVPVIDQKSMSLQEIEQLRDQIKKVDAEAQMQKNAIEERIQSLLAIEAQ